jgi:hypothetical protein
MWHLSNHRMDNEMQSRKYLGDLTFQRSCKRQIWNRNCNLHLIMRFKNTHTMARRSASDSTRITKKRQLSKEPRVVPAGPLHWHKISWTNLGKLWRIKASRRSYPRPLAKPQAQLPSCDPSLGKPRFAKTVRRVRHPVSISARSLPWSMSSMRSSSRNWIRYLKRSRRSMNKRMRKTKTIKMKF